MRLWREEAAEAGVADSVGRLAEFGAGAMDRKDKGGMTQPLDD